MEGFRISLLIVTLCCHSTLSLFNVYPPIHKIPIEGNPGEPLFVTPLLEAGKIDEARTKALVNPPLPGVEDVVSYSGYFTVNKKCNSNLFFWFFPAQVGYKTAPVLLWLQGGPGATSLFGLFTENGPLMVLKGQKLAKRKYTWSKTHSVLYIDNPAGTGFSFTDDDAGYARNQSDVARDLYSALQQFFTLFPDLQKNEFFVTGESYAGKYVPAISYKIHTENPAAKLKINFQGMAIGNGLMDPEHMLHYGDYLYQLGIIDSNARDFFHTKEQEGATAIKNGDWEKAFEVFDTLLNGDLTPYPSFFRNVTGFDFYFNYLHNSDPAAAHPSSDFSTLVQRADIRRSIHVGDRPFGGMSAKLVEQHLQLDVMKSVRPWVEALIEKYRVVIYNGQLDIIVAYPLTLGALQALEWSGAADYKTASRHQWYVGKQLAGYSKTVGHLTEVLVRNAGHMVPGDQPRWALDLISRFTANKPFH
ncbi:hypothetical protein B566_EDAN004139 [Ephemera danica]|nr:hypothetical protein B566_EDAN004139 [Ephemera danica]